MMGTSLNLFKVKYPVKDKTSLRGETVYYDSCLRAASRSNVAVIDLLRCN